MFVISHNTASTYRDKRVDTRQVGRELGVRYVLEGSVQLSGHQIRISAQLGDAENAADLWSERFDGDTGDLFAFAKRHHQTDRSRTQPRIGRRGGCAADRASRRDRIHSPGTRRVDEAADT